MELSGETLHHKSGTLLSDESAIFTWAQCLFICLLVAIMNYI